jgi:hypothetical protein
MDVAQAEIQTEGGNPEIQTEESSEPPPELTDEIWNNDHVNQEPPNLLMEAGTSRKSLTEQISENYKAGYI